MRLGLILSLVIAAAVFGVSTYNEEAKVTITNSFGVRTITSFDRWGRKHGMEIIHRKNGTLLQEAVYSHGSWVWVKEYHENGELAEVKTSGIIQSTIRRFDTNGREIERRTF